MSIVQINRFSM